MVERTGRPHRPQHAMAVSRVRSGSAGMGPGGAARTSIAERHTSWSTSRTGDRGSPYTGSASTARTPSAVHSPRRPVGRGTCPGPADSPAAFQVSAMLSRVAPASSRSYARRIADGKAGDRSSSRCMRPPCPKPVPGDPVTWPPLLAPVTEGPRRHDAGPSRVGAAGREEVFLGEVGAVPDDGGDAILDLVPIVRRVVAARIRDGHLVDDLVQETLARMMVARARLEPDALVPYAIVTARNLIASHAERADRDRRKAHLVVDLDSDPTPEDEVLREERRSIMGDALQRLPRRERDLLVAHEVDCTDTATP